MPIVCAEEKPRDIALIEIIAAGFIPEALYICLSISRHQRRKYRAPVSHDASRPSEINATGFIEAALMAKRAELITGNHRHVAGDDCKP